MREFYGIETLMLVSEPKLLGLAAIYIDLLNTSLCCKYKLHDWVQGNLIIF